MATAENCERATVDEANNGDENERQIEARARKRAAFIRRRSTRVAPTLDISRLSFLDANSS